MKAKTPDPDLRELIRERLRYDPETGELIWISRGVNSPQLVGQIAGTLTVYGYKVVSIRKQHLYAHRIAWLLHYGEWPVTYLDHKNGVFDDNRIDNLRLATIKQNAANSRKGKRGAYLKGVIFERKSCKFIARIRIDGIDTHLGTYATQEAAHAAYMRAARKYFGEFARAA